MTHLITKRLTLRGPQPEDLDDLFAIYSDPRAMEYWSTPPYENRFVTKERLDGWIPEFAIKPHYFSIVHKERVVGSCGAHSGNEIGYILHPDVWGKGMAKEAMQAVIAYLWVQTDFTGLRADLDLRNAASEGLLRSLGVHETGRATNTYCVGGVWIDSLYMVLPRPRSQ